MKVNKKAILGMFVAMVLSLGFMQGNYKSNSSNLQQVSIGCGYMAGETEGGASGAWTAASGIAGGASIAVGYGALTNAWNPAGWVGGAVAGVCAL